MMVLAFKKGNYKKYPKIETRMSGMRYQVFMLNGLEIREKDPSQNVLRHIIKPKHVLGLIRCVDTPIINKLDYRKKLGFLRMPCSADLYIFHIN
jgi:hypothetical protein